MIKKILTFISFLIVWLVFAGRFSLDVIVVGIIASLLTTVLFGDMLYRKIDHKIGLLGALRKGLLFFLFIPVFFYEAVVSALKVSKHVFEKSPSFSPGIVKVKTKLNDVSAITVLANLITLTPGTLTLDFDKSEKVYYIHWIDVNTREEAEARRAIIARFERWLGVIYK